MCQMIDSFDRIIDRFVRSSQGFEETLRAVQPRQWTWPTPCTEWDVRQLVNHVVRGNLNYRRLAEGATRAEFLELRDVDALGTHPLDAYVQSVRDCSTAFGSPGVLQRVLDYPLGRVTGQQALAVRTTDNVIHTWDLARAVGADETLDPELAAWIDDNLHEIYAGLVETPTAATTTHRFFAAAPDAPAHEPSLQDRLLHRMGRNAAN
jgi:uncharacterized protein (TIGR03086 family)